ncbi:MAG: hypothetical protein MJE77_15870 [Proteobacteria bacterium]|nr:hypothetical protein [Pseudomonadota bacterium]
MVASVVLASLGLAGNAMADDSKVMSGNMCQPYFGSTAGDLQSQADGIYNSNATSSRWVSCPIARDNLTNLDGTARVYVRTRRFDAATTMSCNLHSRQSDGTFIESDNAVASGAVLFQSLFLDVNSSASYGFYNIYCLIPPRGRIHSYRVDEFLPTE